MKRSKEEKFKKERAEKQAREAEEKPEKDREEKQAREAGGRS